MDILKQRFRYAVISVAKDYCDISKTHIENPNSEINEIFDVQLLQNEAYKQRIPFYSVKSTVDFYNYNYKYKGNYYDVNNDDKESSGHNVTSSGNIGIGTTSPAHKLDVSGTGRFDSRSQRNGFSRLILDMFYGEENNQFYTTKDKHIKRHYGRPFSSVTIVTFNRTIKIDGDKLIAKSYKTIRSRGINKKFFKRIYNSHSLTIDLKTGNFTTGEVNYRGKILNKRFRKNGFAAVENLLTINSFARLDNHLNKKLSIYKEFIMEMDDGVFTNTILHCINQPFLKNPINEALGQHEFLNSLIKFFVNRKQIKTPNEYKDLIRFHYPGEKYLKKNDRKLILSVLDSYGIKSKLSNKILHENIYLDINEFKNFASFFGKDYTKYISSLNKSAIQIFVKRKDNGVNHLVPIPIVDRRGVSVYSLKSEEKENIIKIVNSLTSSNEHQEVLKSVSGLYGLFRDHIDMIEKLREYNPSYKLNSKNYDEFHMEHMEISKLVALIKSGWSTEYVYDNRAVRKIESPIKYEYGGVNYEFNPVILKRGEEYSEEGAFMHHCVASYSSRSTSMIVSIRVNGGKDRVTCEYDKKSGESIQERHFCNRIPPEYFNKSLNMVRERIRSLRFSRLLEHIDIKRVRVQINGKEVGLPPQPEEPFFGYL